MVNTEGYGSFSEPDIQIHHLVPVKGIKGAVYEESLSTIKVLDARRRRATTEVYGSILRKEERLKATTQMMP